MATRQSHEQLLDELESILKGRQPFASKVKTASSFVSIENLDATDDDSGEEGGSGTGAPGSTEPLMDLSVFGLTSSAEFLLAEQIRKGESQFGWVPNTKDPTKPRQSAEAGNRGPQRHPLLSESQRFDGADPKLNALPTDNPEAREQYNRLANELRPAAKPTNTYVETPTFKPI